MTSNVNKGIFIGIALSVVHILVNILIPHFYVDRSLYYVVGALSILLIILFLVSEKAKSFFTTGFSAVLTIVFIQMLFFIVNQYGGWEKVFSKIFNPLFKLF